MIGERARQEERRAVASTLRRFAQRVERSLFAGEEPDGDLACVPSLLAELRELGVLADPSPDHPGHELGVWGQHCREEGAGLSLLALSLLGEACAGFAAAVHAQGLGCLALDGQEGFPPGAALAAAFTPHYGLPFGPEGSGLRLEGQEGGLRLHGGSHFLLAAGPPAGLVCFARAGDGPEAEWAAVAVEGDAQGVELAPAGRRTGLRGAHQYHVRCEQAPVQRELQRGAAARRALQRVVACDWLGQAAIALGAARRAARDARTYAAQRYQGGRIIEEHASVRLLLGTAQYDAGLLADVLQRHAGVGLSSLEPAALLRWAAEARLAVGEHAQRAVTDCLQVLGGYGYMEDYGMEKRLRDVSVLKSLHGAPDRLRLLLDDLARGEDT
jgi:hypothetical protein